TAILLAQTRTHSWCIPGAFLVHSRCIPGALMLSRKAKLPLAPEAKVCSRRTNE
ncbi:hypothetical protein L873DRAFT_1804001, partial [Choiromyces venosus 120613-1]